MCNFYEVNYHCANWIPNGCQGIVQHQEQTLIRCEKHDDHQKGKSTSPPDPGCIAPTKSDEVKDWPDFEQYCSDCEKFHQDHKRAGNRKRGGKREDDDSNDFDAEPSRDPGVKSLQVGSKATDASISNGRRRSGRLINKQGAVTH